MTSGLYDKYSVVNKETGEQAKGVFVLKPSSDPAALKALKTYAEATTNFILKSEIEEWIKRIENPCLFKPACKKTGEFTCCALCGNRDECYEEDYPDLCYLVADNEVSDKEYCDIFESYLL